MSFFPWGGGETEDRAKVSTLPLFEGLLINNNELRDNSTQQNAWQCEHDLK